MPTTGSVYAYQRARERESERARENERERERATERERRKETGTLAAQGSSIAVCSATDTGMTVCSSLLGKRRRERLAHKEQLTGEHHALPVAAPLKVVVSNECEMSVKIQRLIELSRYASKMESPA